MRGVLPENTQGPDPLRGRFLLLLQVRRNILHFNCHVRTKRLYKSVLRFILYRCVLMYTIKTRIFLRTCTTRMIFGNNKK